MYNSNDKKTEVAFLFLAGIVLMAIVVVVGGWLLFAPIYRVWSAEKEGQAQLAQAEGNRRITVLEAQAKLDAATHLAQAEIKRAEGVAQANKIIGNSLKDNESYLRWLWIENLDKGNNSVIYIPTEAGLPILEAGKR
jgi:regulator of protease activity HflC (stomatin/prohibitin superfamily)